MKTIFLACLIACFPASAATTGARPRPQPKARPRPNQEKFARLYRAVVTLNVALSDKNVRVFDFQKMATDAKVEAAVSAELATTEIEREFVTRATAAAKGAEEVGHGMSPEVGHDIAEGEAGLMAESMIGLKDDIAATIAIYRGEVVPLGQAAEFPRARLTNERTLVRTCEKVDDLEILGEIDEGQPYKCRNRWIKYAGRDSLFSLMGGCLGANVVLVTQREENKLLGVAYRCEQPNP